MSNNPATPLSPSAAQEAAEAVITERNASLARANIGATIIIASCLALTALGAALPAGAALYLYGPASALWLLAGARTLGEHANVRKLDSMRHNVRSAHLEEPMTRRNTQLSTMGRYARLGGLALLGGAALGFLAGGLAVGLGVLLAAGACEGVRQFVGGGMRSAAKLDKEIRGISDSDAMVTPIGSGGKFRAVSQTPSFNDAAEPSTETAQAISIRKPLQLKQPAAT